MSIDTAINDALKPISEAALNTVLYAVNIGGVDFRLLIVMLIAAAVFFTVYLKFVNFRYFKHAINIVRGKFDREQDAGQINSYQAMMASLSGTVGLGNIAGVAVAVSVGGAGAAFWMCILGLLCMSTKFAEVTLGVKYRQQGDKDDPNAMYGGPMYYLRDGLKSIGLTGLGRILSIIFTISCIAGAIGGGNLFQVNQTFQQVYLVTGGEAGFWAGKGWLFGIFMSILVGVVIIGGIKSIARVSEAIVPLMAFVYLGAGLIVIALHYQNIPSALAEIFTQALTPAAGFGGVIGALMVGAQRAAFSNESGLGTAAIVYAAARTRHPITQGMASMLGPFIDTVVICMMTALVIVTTGVHHGGAGMEGVELTSRAFASGISWFPYVLAFAVFLFAYSTLITFAYYGVQCMTFLFGQSKKMEMGFKIFFCLCTVIGSSVSLGALIDLTDAMFLSMVIPNVIGLFLLAPQIKAELNDYLSNHIDNVSA